MNKLIDLLPVKLHQIQSGSFYNKFKNIQKCTGLLVLFLLLSFSETYAATKTWALTSGGAWGNGSSWVGGALPIAGDDIVINLTTAGTITGVPTIVLNSISIGGTVNTTLTGAAGVTVTISNALTSSALNIVGGGTLTLGGGTAATSVNLTFSSITNATSIAGTLAISVASTLADGGNTIVIAGNIINNGTHSGTGEILLAGGSAAHAISGGTCTFGNLELNDPYGATFTGTGATTLSGYLLVTQGTLTMNAFTTSFTVNGTTSVGIGATNGSLSFTGAIPTTTFTGLVTIGTNGTWNNTNNAIIFRGGITNSGTFNAGSGIQTFNTNSQALTGTFSIPSVTVSGVTLTNNNALTITTALAGTGGLTQAANAMLYIDFTGAIGITTLTASANGNTVDYNFNGSQTIKTPATSTYYNLMTDISGIKTLVSAMTVSGSITVSGASIFADGGFLITGVSGNTFTLGAGSTYTSTKTTDPCFPINMNYALNSTSTVNLNGTGTITFTAFPTSFGNLTFGAGAASVKTLPPTTPITINGILTINATNSLADNGNTVTVEGNLLNNGTHSGTGEILLAGGSAAHAISGGTCTFGNLELNDPYGATFTGTGATTLSGYLLVTQGTLTMNAFTTSFTVNGTTSVGIGATNGSLSFTGAIPTTTFSGLVTIGTNGTWNNTNNGIIFRGGITNSGTFNAGSGIQTFNTNSQALTGTFSIPSVTVSGVTLTNNNALTITTALAGTGGLTQAANAMLYIDFTGAIGITTLTASANGNTVDYNFNGSQTIKTPATSTYYNLMTDISGIKTLASAMTVSSSLTINNGTLADGGFVITVNGNVINNGLHTGTGSVTLMGGSIAHTITGTGSFQNVILNDNYGVTLGGNMGINGTLTFTHGLILLNNYNLSLLLATSTIAGTLSSSNMVVVNGTGQMFKWFAAGASGPFTYPIGDVSGNYTPVVFSFTGTGNQTAGLLGVQVSGSENPMNPPTTNYIKRYWTFTAPALSSYIYSATFQYVATDVMGSEADFLDQIYNSSSWTTDIGSSTNTGTHVLSSGSSLTNSLNNSVFTAYNAGTSIYYWSKATGNWSAPATWEVTTIPVDPGVGNGTPATNYPTILNSNGITIRSANTVTANNSYTADNLTVNGILTIPAAQTLTIAGGGFNPDMLVNGTVTNAGIITPTGTISFSGTSVYNHNQNGGTIPTATWAASATTNVTFGASATLNGLAQSFGNFNYTPSGAFILTLGQSPTIQGNLTLTGATGTFAIAANTVNLAGNLSGNGILSFTSGILNIAGNYTGTGTFTSGSGTVNYNGANQQIGALSYYNLTMSGIGPMTLSGNTSLTGTLNLTSGVILLGAYNLTLSGANGLSAITGTYGKTSMIETDGAGKLIFTNAALAGASLNGTYPLGNNGDYNPVVLLGLNGAVANRTFNINVVAGQLFEKGINRYWFISQSGVALTGDPTLSFTYNTTEASSDYTKYQPFTNVTGTWTLAPTPSAQGVNPITSILATVLPASSEWTAATPNSLYSYQSGSWNNPTTWTTDPSGTTLINPLNSIPGDLDNVTILSSITVSLASNVTAASLYLNINAGGFLNMGTYSFSNGLNTLKGQGTLQLASTVADNFPSAITNTFVTVGGGTTEYDASVIMTQTVHNNLSINAPSSTVIYKNSATTLTLNGNLSIAQGTFQINDATTQRIKVTVNGNVTVNNGASFTVGTGVTNTTTVPTGITTTTTAPFINYYDAQSHRIVVMGNFTNNGNVRFTNLPYPVYNAFPPTTNGATTGFATVYFQGSTNNTLTCNGQTDFYNLVLDKGSDQTFLLTVYSTNYSNFRLFGANTAVFDIVSATNANPNMHKALWVRNGTLDLTGLIAIPSLTEGTTGYPTTPTSDYFIPFNGALVLDGAFVTVLSSADDFSEVNAAYSLTGGSNAAYGINIGTGSALSVLGKLQLNNGYLSTRESSGLLYWSYASGQIVINNGTLDAKQFHNPEGGTNGLVSYRQTGGNVILRGRFQNTVNYTTPASLAAPTINYVRLLNGVDGTATIGTFSLNGNVGNGFSMTGGNISIYDVCGTTATPYAFLVNTTNSNNSVTGGTVQIIPTSYPSGTGTLADANYLINSTASFENLVVNQVSGSSIVQLNTNPLGILQNLNIQAGTLDANKLNVSIGGNFSIGSGSTYLCTGTSANRTIFNGLGTQTFTSNVASPLNLNRLIVRKASTDALVFAGTTNTISMVDSLMIVSGKLNDNGNVINASGGVYNGGIEYGTGKIALVGIIAQTIDGNGSGVFNNLDINNTAALVAPVTLTAATSVNGLLNLVSNKIFIIGSNNLTLNANASISSGSGFTNTCFIQTSGKVGDGGITRVYNSIAPFTFPVGAFSTNRPSTYAYTPATIGFTIAPTQYGSLTVIPVGNEDPNTTTKGISLTYYWHVVSSGFTLASNSVTQSYTFALADVNSTLSKYVPARFNNANFTWSYGTTASINTTTDIMGLGSGDPFFYNCNYLDGDYTAGNDNPTNPFGTPKVYYSRQSGLWSNVNTWSTVSHTGAASTAVPGAMDIVLIGNKDSVYLATNNTTINTGVQNCAELQIEYGSALDIGYNPGCTFNVVTNNTQSSLGNGNFRLTTSWNSGSTYVFPSGDFSSYNENLGSTELYSTNTASGTTYWLPQGVTTYGNLILSPLGGSNIIFANNSLNIYGNLITRGQNADSWFCPTWNVAYPTAPTVVIAKTITVQGNLLIEGGSLIWYGNTNAQNFVVDGNVVVSNWGAIQNWGGSNQSMSIGGSLINNTMGVVGNGASQTTSEVDFNTNGAIPVTFFGPNNASITNTSGTPLTVFNTVTIDKGNSQTTTLTCNIGGTLTTPVDNWLTMQSGTFIYNSAPNLNISTITAFTIPSSSGLIVNTTANVNIAQGNNSTNTFYLGGNLTINNGNVYVGSAANNQHNDIEYSSGGASTIIVNGGSLTVNGAIRRNPSDYSGILSYTQTGSSSVTINGNSALATNAKLEVLNAGSQFNMSGTSTLTIVRGGGGNTFGDLFLRPQSGSISGGTIILSQGALAAAESYLMDATIPLNNLNITGASGYVASVKLMVSPLNINGALTINQYSTLDANNALNINVTVTGNFMNNGTYNSEKNITTFNGNVQSILGTTLNTFYNLNVEPVTSLTLNGNTTVNDTLVIGSGSLICGANKVNLSGNLINNGNYTDNDVSGTGISLIGASLQYISGTGSFSWLELNNPNGAMVNNDITLQENLVMTQGLFNLGNNLLTLMQNSTIVANGTPFSLTKMVITNGVLGNTGINKFYSVTPQTFLYPIGTSGMYTPASLTFTASQYVGSLRVNPINSTQPSVIDPTNALDYYWDVQSSGLSGFAGTLIFNYLESQVVGSQESSYLTARLLVPGTSWSLTNGVNTALKTLTFTYPSGTENLSGEYTAGISSCFPANIPTFTSIANGNWNDNTIWTQTAGTPYTLATGTGPNGFIVIINDTVTANTNYCEAYQTVINGELKVVTPYFGHDFGTVTGSGTLYLQSGTFPAGVFDAFLNCSNNATVEYGGTGTYTIVADLFTEIPNMKFSGTGSRILPDQPLTICNNFIIGTISGGPIVDNSVYNQTLTILGSMQIYGTSSFVSGTGANATVIFAGSSAQTVGGSLGNFTGASSFNNLEINNASGLTINSGGVIQLNGNLLLTDGLINTSSNGTLTINNTSGNCVTPAGGSSSSYVNGPLTKLINQGDNFYYPIGQGSIPGNMLNITNTQTGPLYWTVQYFNPNSTFNSYAAPLAAVNWSDYWTISANANSQCMVNLNWTPSSDITPLTTIDGMSDLRVVQYLTASSNWNAIASTSSGNNYNGTVSTTGVITIPSTGSENFSIGSVTTVIPKAKLLPTGAVCGTSGIPVNFSAPVAIPLNYTLNYLFNGTPQTVTVTSVPYTLPTPTPGKYQLTGFIYNSGAGTGVVDSMTIVDYNIPTTSIAGANQSQCGITSIQLDANTPTIGVGKWSIISGDGGTVLSPNSPTSQLDGILPNSYILQWTISNGNCLSSSNVSVYFTIRPDPPTASSAQSFCVGSTIANLESTPPNGSTVNWYTTSTGGTSLTISTLLLNGSTYYGESNSGGCISASRTPVTVSLFPQPIGPTLLTQTPGTANVCSGTIVSATFSSGSGGVGCSDAFQYIFDGGASFAYAPGASLNTLGHTSVVIQGQRAGCAVGAGCSGTSWVTLASWTVNALPLAITGTSNICVGSTSTLNDATAGGTWSSSNNAIATINASTGEVTGISAGTSLITYTLTATGCSISTTITVNAAPDAITGTNNVCMGNNTTLNDVTSGGIWSSSNNSLATINASTGVVTGVSSGTITILYTLTSTGCSVSEPMTINSIPLPISGSSSVCTGSNITLTDATTSGTWSSSNNSVATINASTGEVTGVSFGTSSIMYMLSSTGCAVNSTVTVNPSPTLSSTLTPGSICSNTSFSYIPTSATGGTTFGWSRSMVAGISNASSSGTGNPGETLINTSTSPVAVTYVYTLTANGCVNTQDVTVTVNPSPTLSSTLTPGSICSNMSFSYIPTSATGGTTFGWSRSMVAGISNASSSGTGNPGETLINTSTSPVAVTYVYTLTANGCVNTQDVAVTVNPSPTLSSTLTPGSICSNTSFSYIPTSATGGTTFGWSRSIVAGISNASSSGTGNPGETLINTSTSPVAVTYVYTLTANGCVNTQDVTVTVNPSPTLSSTLTPGSICSNTSFSYIPTSATGGTTFGWSRSMVAGISNASSSGTGNPGETLINTSTSPVAVTYVYTLTANGCVNTQDVAVTVNPSPTLSSTLTPGSICSNTSFSYIPTSATGGTTFGWSRSMVAGISNASSSGTGNPGETLINTSTSPVAVTYVYTLTANGCVNTQDVTVTVNPSPTLSSTLTPGSICSNTSFSYIPTSATGGTTFGWSRSMVAGISNASSSGTGNPGETLINTSTSPVAVTYVYTLTANGCVNTQDVTVTVNPSPTLSSTLTPGSICSNTSFSYIPTSATGGTTFGWSRSIVAGISNASSSGTGNPGETLINTSTSPVAVTYVYTLTANGCVNTQDVTVTVNPSPTLSSTLTPGSICSNTSFSYIPTSATGGTTFGWSRSMVAGISNASSSGTGNPGETLINTSTSPVAVTYVYTLTANGCVNTQDVTVTVNPSPTLSSTLTPGAICSNTSFSYIPTSATGGTTFGWSRSMVAGISNASSSGTGNPGETLINTSTSPVAVTYVYTLTANGCVNTQDVAVTVNPSPTLSSTLTPGSICSNTSFSYIPTSATGGTTFGWSRSMVAGISNASSSGTGNPGETLINTSTSPVAVTYVYTLTANGCVNTQDVTVTVNPIPISISGETTLCAGSSTLLVGSPAGGFWISETPAIATINNSGLVNGILEGTTIIEYYFVESCSINTTINVNPTPNTGPVYHLPN